MNEATSTGPNGPRIFTGPDAEARAAAWAKGEYSAYMTDRGTDERVGATRLSGPAEGRRLTEDAQLELGSRAAKTRTAEAQVTGSQDGLRNLFAFIRSIGASSARSGR